MKAPAPKRLQLLGSCKVPPGANTSSGGAAQATEPGRMRRIDHPSGAENCVTRGEERSVMVGRGIKKRWECLVWTQV